MGNPDCECTDNPNAVHNSVTLTDTRVTESDCGKPENELSELVRSGYNTILYGFKGYIWYVQYFAKYFFQFYPIHLHH